MNELKELSKALDRLITLRDINQEYMDADDLGDLEANIDGLRKMYSNTYKRQVSQFVEYLETSLCDDEAIRDEWLDTPYIITHGSKSVTIDNFADVYEGIINLLKDHLNDLV